MSRKFSISIIILFLGIVFPVAVHAADLYFSPASGSYDVGQTFFVGIYVNSAGQAINATSGVLSFAQDKLEVISISKEGSIIDLWVQEPSFSNSLGTVSFEGIVLNPGFTGLSGKVIQVQFRTKVPGAIPLVFSSGSVLANDGQGTNILSALGQGSYSVGISQGTEPPVGVSPPPPTPAPAPVPVALGALAPPEITSSTHPDPDKWYPSNEVQFSWPLPEEVTATRILVNIFPETAPTISYDPPISSRDLSALDLEDGVWYFHVRLRNAEGWGESSHMKFQIDTEKPERFEIIEQKREDLTDPVARFLFDAFDATSGIDHYEIQIDGGEFVSWVDDGSHIYETSPQGPGNHLMIVKAVDGAGNILANSAEFQVDALEPPVITNYPENIESGETFKITGDATYANIQVVLWFQKQEGITFGNAQLTQRLGGERELARSWTTQSDENGLFEFESKEKLERGEYTLWVEIVDERGARSDFSEPVQFIVEQPPLIRIGSQAITLLSVVTPLVALVLVTFFLFWWSWRKVSHIRKSATKEARQAEGTIKVVFDTLEKQAKDVISLLEKTEGKRSLTKEEQEITRRLKRTLARAETTIKKEVKDIEKKLK